MKVNTYYEKLEGSINAPLTPLDLEIIEKIRGLITPTQFSQPYLTRLEVCDILKITLPTLYAWVKSGILKGYRLGNRVYFKRQEIDEALTAIPARDKGVNHG